MKRAEKKSKKSGGSDRPARSGTLLSHSTVLPAVEQQSCWRRLLLDDALQLLLCGGVADAAASGTQVVRTHGCAPPLMYRMLRRAGQGSCSVSTHSYLSRARAPRPVSTHDEHG